MKQSLPFPPASQPLAATHLLFVPMDLPVLDILYKRSDTICDLLHLSSLTWHKVSRFIHVEACVSTAFLFLAECYSIGC